ncbi:hypothetical protein [Paraburkholderia dilworthii]|uniref:Uncharacterized protein n=1 Tax=Paraburkholderia dilworthii TaxID=948106 RepID=A0ABW9DGA1_9BURK
MMNFAREKEPMGNEGQTGERQHETDGQHGFPHNVTTRLADDTNRSLATGNTGKDAGRYAVIHLT